MATALQDCERGFSQEDLRGKSSISLVFVVGYASELLLDTNTEESPSIMAELEKVQIQWKQHDTLRLELCLGMQL